MLLSRGAITEAQLKIAIEEQKRSKRPLGAVLVTLGFISEEQVAAAIGAQWGYPVMSHTGNAKSTVRIPRTLQEFYGVVPVHYAEEGKRLIVGFVQRVHHTLLSAIERMTSCSALACFITDGEYRRRVVSADAPRAESELLFDRFSSGAEMAKITTSYAMQIGAGDARFESCGRHLWVRLYGQRGELDLLFQPWAN
jgi:hypothetical protein